MMTIEVHKSDWPVVALAILAGITAAAHVGKAPPALPLLRAELDLTIVQAGWVVSMIAAMAMASGMVAGIVADRIGHRRQMIIGLSIMAVSGAVGSMAAGADLLLATRFLEGLGFISVAVSAPSLIITSILPHHRQVVLGVWSLWVPGGMALSMLISPLILGPLGWRSLWLFWAALALLLVLVLLVKAGKEHVNVAPSEQRHSFIDSLRLILSRPGPSILALNFGVFAAQWGSLMVWIPSYLVERRDMDISMAAILGGFVIVANVPGNLMGSWLLHRGIERRHIIGGTHLIMGLCALGIFSDSLPDMTRFGLALLFSHAAGYLPAAMFASVPVHAPSPQQFGATSGLLLQGSNTGNFFGPPAVAAVVAALGSWSGVLWFMMACAGTGLVLSVWLSAIEKRVPLQEG
jgi:cyanate permease